MACVAGHNQGISLVVSLLKPGSLHVLLVPAPVILSETVDVLLLDGFEDV